MKLPLFAAVLAASIASVTTAHAMLQVDFNNNNNNQTETGYTGLTQGQAAAGTAISGVTVKLESAASIDGAQGGGAGQSPVPTQLTRDYAFADAGDASFMDLVLTSLPAGAYTFTGVFHDTNGSNATIDLSLSTDGNPPTFLQSVVQTSGSNGPGTSTFNLTAIDGEEVRLRIASRTGDHLINGFSLAAVPEAGAFLVWSMLSGVAMTRYRGKRRA
ncbi:hypothetical protein KOR34_48130 [Posidoniimonas corsicana]|uniref:PEP-CTERM protein-sorting domain-containing protein n=1 Tax=Posidoniimonas corsicana TaxID=1938618 RepID=A0A5C5UXT8_9BACT|nr:hypothetical protein [Posidoniimonas corsicana]TWT30255.1 hypothetical protein KOR34_48130 [Posidoniimonas corsicana]